MKNYTDTEVKNWINQQVEMFQNNAKGFGFEAIQARLKLEAINKLPEAIATALKPVEPPKEDKPQVVMSNGFPIPFEYTEIVHTILNKKFGVDIKYQSEAAAFEFAILVPKEYSNAGEPHWQTYGEDRRSKVIQNAYGANGVREWVVHVYENFNPEVRSKITYDRAQI